jgi:hypothetical protein
MANADFDSSIRGKNSTEESVTETVTATVTVKNQKTRHWFLCYKFVKLIIVAQPSERSNKTKCQISINKFFVALPRQHVTILML